MLCCIMFVRIRNECNSGVSGGGGDSEKHNSAKCVTWHGTLCDDELCQA